MASNTVLYLTAFLITLGTLVHLRFRKRIHITTSRNLKFNFLNLPVIKKMIRWKYFRLAINIPNLIIFGFVIVYGFIDIQNASRNIATPLTWVLWWSAVIFTFVLIGRVWCAVCPFAFLGDVVQKIFSFNKKFPKKLQNIWIQILLFQVLTWGFFVWSIGGSPLLTSLFGLVLTGGAVLTAVFYEKRTFCRYLCPLGGMIGLYSMTSPFELRSINKGSSPCINTCPIHQNAQGYISLIAHRKFDEALKMIRRENPLPSICGKVCHHPCEIACVREDIDSAVAINALKRAAVEYSTEDLMPRIGEMQDKKVAVIGSGPSGLSVAHSLALKGYSTTVFESHQQAGGMLIQGIPEYRLPREDIDQDLNFLKKMGIKIETDVSIGKDISFNSLVDDYDSICIAVGNTQSKQLNIEGENAANLMSGLDYLKRINAGDKIDIGKKVSVIGGGNTAIDAARTALRNGADVTVIYRRTIEEMPAVDEEILEAQLEGVKIQYLVSPVKFKLNGSQATHIVCQKMEPGETETDGRRKSIPVEGSEFEIEVDTVLTSIGEDVDLSFLPENIEILKEGRIKTDNFGSTSTEKIFAAGDVINGPDTVINAIASAKKVADNIDCYLSNREMNQLNGRVEIDKEWLINEIRTGKKLYTKGERIEIPKLSNADRGSFEEVNLGYTRDDAVEEAKRCLNCGGCSDYLVNSSAVFQKDCQVACPMLEFPQHLDRNTNCNLCLDCVSGCQKDNIRFTARPFGEGLWASKTKKLDESVKAMILLGVTTIQTAVMLRLWPSFQDSVSSALGITGKTGKLYITYTLMYLFFTVLVPVSVLFLGTLASKQLSGDPKIKLKKLFISIGYMFVPMGLTVHLAHNIRHLLAEGQTIVAPVVRLLNKITPFNFGKPNWDAEQLVGNNIIFILQIIVIFLGMMFTLKVSYFSLISSYEDRKKSWRMLLPFALITFLVLILNIWVLSSPMAHRH